MFTDDIPKRTCALKVLVGNEIIMGFHLIPKSDKLKTKWKNRASLLQRGFCWYKVSSKMGVIMAMHNVIGL